MNYNDDSYNSFEEERYMSRSKQFGDGDENNIRPISFKDYSGQEKVKSNIEIFIKAAKSRGEALDHVLLYGPPGLGKTTLSQVLLLQRWALICILQLVLQLRRLEISQQSLLT